MAAEQQLIRRGVDSPSKTDRFDPPYHELELRMYPIRRVLNLNEELVNTDTSRLSIFVSDHSICIARLGNPTFTLGDADIEQSHTLIVIQLDKHCGLPKSPDQPLSLFTWLDRAMKRPFQIIEHPIGELLLQYESYQTEGDILCPLVYSRKTRAFQYQRVHQADLLIFLLCACGLFLYDRKLDMQIGVKYDHSGVVLDHGQDLCFSAYLWFDKSELHISDIRYDTPFTERCKSGSVYLAASLSLASFFGLQRLTLNDASNIKSMSVLVFGSTWYGRWGFECTHKPTLKNALTAYRFLTWSPELRHKVCDALQQNMLSVRQVEYKTLCQTLMDVVKNASDEEFVTSTFAKQLSPQLKRNRSIATEILKCCKFPIALVSTADFQCERPTQMIPPSFEVSDVALHSWYQHVLPERRRQYMQQEAQHRRENIKRIRAETHGSWFAPTSASPSLPIVLQHMI